MQKSVFLLGFNQGITGHYRNNSAGTGWPADGSSLPADQCLHPRTTRHRGPFSSHTLVAPGGLGQLLSLSNYQQAPPYVPAQHRAANNHRVSVSKPNDILRSHTTNLCEGIVHILNIKSTHGILKSLKLSTKTQVILIRDADQEMHRRH